jgi:NTP pyrophosphatase (non-canonical NTP hydrolase)
VSDAPNLPQTSKAPPAPVPDFLSQGAHTAADPTFRSFQKLIYDRYHATDSARGSAATFLWLMEEVGELATALSNNAPGRTPTAEEKANLAEEFADVFAWLTTIANIQGVDLSKALEKYTKKKIEGEKF